MTKKDTIKHAILYISIAVILITTAFSASRAYFLMQISGNDTVKPTTISAANIDIDFITSSYINEPKMMLIKDSEKDSAPSSTFAVSSKASTTVSVEYTLFLTELTISSGFVSQDFKWELVKVDNGSETEVASGNFSDAVSGKDYTLTTSSITIKPNDTHTYKFRVWLSYTDKDQSELLNGEFKAKIGYTTGKIVASGA